MKISKKSTMVSKKTLIICLVASLLILGSIVAFLHSKTNVFGNNPDKNNSKNINTIDYNPPTSEQTNSGTSIKAGNGSTDKPSTPAAVEGSTKKQVGLVIVNASKTQINVQINTVVNSGTCTLTLSSPGQTTITQTSEVQPLASFSACKTFNYPEIPSGTWTISILYTSDTLTGSVTSTRSL